MCLGHGKHLENIQNSAETTCVEPLLSIQKRKSKKKERKSDNLIRMETRRSPHRFRTKSREYNNFENLYILSKREEIFVGKLCKKFCRNDLRDLILTRVVGVQTSHLTRKVPNIFFLAMLTKPHWILQFLSFSYNISNQNSLLNNEYMKTL